MDEKPVRHVAGPLGVILPRGIPQERIADGRIGDGEILRQPEPANRHPIEDHVERIEPARAPGRRRRQALVHELAELGDPGIEAALQCVRRGGREAGAEYGSRERIEALRVARRRAGRRGQVGKE